MHFARFERPSRYIHREKNAIYKEAPVTVALVFPDVYDIGMSHLGLRILYDIVNAMPYASAERVFCPWPDLEEELRSKEMPLRSLEGKRPLADFAIVGFSLQYELSYTTVLNMLSLGRLPLRREDRDGRSPLIIAGGPCTVNPAPMSAFIDAFLIGDGEEALPELITCYYDWKHGGDGRRESLFRGLAEINGVYVPAVHGPLTTAGLVRRRFIQCLEDAPFPTSPVVPFTSIIHDRITVEISRGCTQGCRFCQAGMIYRPLRQRSPEKIVRIVEETFRNSGYEEVSLSSLSAGDYPHLLPLVKDLNRRLSEKVVSLSLPSLRVGAVCGDVLREISSVRKTGFTMAPEAATDRLRMVINKDFTEEDYERALQALFSEGWETIKLYFMVGLPTEQGEDIEAIPGMALKALKAAKQHTRRYVNVNVSVSPFVPKSHTPFQWMGQEKISSIREKLDYLRQHMQRKKITYKGHNPDTSLLEAVFARGDEGLADLLEKAREKGCRLDAWTESFDIGKWREAAEDAGIDLHAYAERAFGEGDILPWEGVDIGVRKDFLLKELRRSLAAEKTPDCSMACTGCGLACRAPGERTVVLPATVRSPRSAVPAISPTRSFRPIRVRVCFSKTGDLRFLSHREVMTALIRAARRAALPVLYSQGFHPSPRLSFGPPLSVGIAGLREFFDMELKSPSPLGAIKEAFNGTLPSGLSISEVAFLGADATSLDSFISRYEYEIICPDSRAVEAFAAAESFLIVREKDKGSPVQYDIRGAVEDIAIVDGETVRFAALDRPGSKARINEILGAPFQPLPDDLVVTRTAMYGWAAGWVSPMGTGVRESGQGTFRGSEQKGKGEHSGDSLPPVRTDHGQ